MLMNLPPPFSRPAPSARRGFELRGEASASTRPREERGRRACPVPVPFRPRFDTAFCPEQS